MNDVENRNREAKIDEDRVPKVLATEKDPRAREVVEEVDPEAETRDENVQERQKSIAAIDLDRQVHPNQKFARS
jgi:hypothetical protein